MPLLRRWLQRRDPDRDLDEEFATHVSLEAERQVARGVTPAEARDIAERKFGSQLRYREEVRDLQPAMALERLALDLRYALRALGRRPFATGAAIVALALGLGGPTAVLMLLANLSTAVYPQVKDPDSLVTLWETGPGDPTRLRPVEAARQVVERHADFFAGLGVAQPPTPISMTLNELPEHVSAQPLGAGVLPLLGVSPHLGRAFVESDEAASAAPVVITSFSFWQARLGASREVIGTTIRLDGRAHTIVGVMPRAFWFSNRGVDVWVPLPQGGPAESRYVIMARLLPGDTKETLSRKLASLTQQIAAAAPEREPGWSLSVVGMGPRSTLNDQLQPGVIMLVVATGLALLVACANVAMVMVARGAERQKETAVRSALGAARGRLIRQFLAESTLIAIAGGALALLVAYAGMWLIVANAPMDLTLAINVHMDWRVVAAVAGLSVAVGLLAGLAPALADSRVNLVAALKETGFFTSAPGRARLRRGLIVVEVAMTVMLIASVSLLVRGVADLAGTDPGFDPENLMLVRIDPVQHVGKQESRTPSSRDVLDRVRQIRGIESAAATLGSPLGAGQSRRVGFDDDRTAGATPPTRVVVNEVTADYFRTLGLSVLDGEPFSDGSAFEPVAVVSRAFARRHWPGGRAVGERLRIDDESPRRVVAVVSDLLMEGGRRAPSALVFIPYRDPPPGPGKARSMSLLVRAQPGAADVPGGLRRAVADVDPLQPVRVASIQDILDVGLQEVRVSAYVAAPLMLLSLLLTVSGIYGLLAQTVAQRTHELAVRVTLGAGRGHLLRLVTRDSLRLAGLGAALGIASALMVDRAASAFLFGVPGEEPFALAGAALAILVVTLLASLVPYRRALRVDPGRTLRYE